jgi:hypothetical protein
VTRDSRLHLLAPATTTTAAQLTGAVGSAGTVAATGTALLGGLIARHDTSPQVWVASFWPSHLQTQNRLEHYSGLMGGRVAGVQPWLLTRESGLLAPLHRAGFDSVAALQCFPDLGQCLIPGVRLGQKRDVKRLKPMLNQYFGGMGRHIEQPLIGPLLQDDLPQLHPVAVRHDHVQNHQIYPAPGLAEHLERLGGGFRLQDPIPFLTQNAVGDAPGKPLVVNDQDGGGDPRKWKSQDELPPRDGLDLNLMVPVAVVIYGPARCSRR